MQTAKLLNYKLWEVWDSKQTFYKNIFSATENRSEYTKWCNIASTTDQKEP